MAISGLKLRCPMSATKSMKVIAPSGGYTAGQMVRVEDVVGIIVAAAAAGAEAVLIYKADKVLVPCAAAATAGYAVGEKVYFDDANDEVTEVASGTYLCGFVTEASSVGDEEVEIELDGTLEIVA